MMKRKSVWAGLTPHIDKLDAGWKRGLVAGTIIGVLTVMVNALAYYLSYIPDKLIQALSVFFPTSPIVQTFGVYIVVVIYAFVGFAVGWLYDKRNEMFASGFYSNWKNTAVVAVIGVFLIAPAIATIGHTMGLWSVWPSSGYGTGTMAVWVKNSNGVAQNAQVTIRDIWNGRNYAGSESAQTDSSGRMMGSYTVAAGETYEVAAQCVNDYARQVSKNAVQVRANQATNVMFGGPCNSAYYVCAPALDCGDTQCTRCSGCEHARADCVDLVANPTGIGQLPSAVQYSDNCGVKTDKVRCDTAGGVYCISNANGQAGCGSIGPGMDECTTSQLNLCVDQSNRCKTVNGLRKLVPDSTCAFEPTTSTQPNTHQCPTVGQCLNGYRCLDQGGGYWDWSPDTSCNVVVTTTTQPPACSPPGVCNGGARCVNLGGGYNWLQDSTCGTATTVTTTTQPGQTTTTLSPQQCNYDGTCQQWESGFTTQYAAYAASDVWPPANTCQDCIIISCNYNTVCEANLGETTYTCAYDCKAAKPWYEEYSLHIILAVTILGGALILNKKRGE